MIRFKLFPLLFVVFLACHMSQKETTDFKLALQENRLNGELRNISLMNARPGIELQIGEKETSLQWFPDSLVEPAKTKRRTPMGDAVDHTAVWQHPDGYELGWTVSELQGLDGVTLRSSFTNNSDRPLRLHNFTLCRTQQNGLICSGDPAAWWLLPAMRYSRQAGNLAQVFPSALRLKEQQVYGYAEIENTDPRNQDGHWRRHEEAMTLYSQTDRHGLVFGAVGPGVSFVTFNCRVDSGAVLLEIISEMDDILVEPGETRHSEEVLILAQPYKKALTTLFSWIAETHGTRRQQDAIFGWLSWYDVFFDVTTSQINAIADVTKNYRDRIPLGVIQIDMGWELGDDKHFSMIVDKSKFPDGLQPVVEKIKEAGAIPGIWMAPSYSDLKRPDVWYQNKKYTDPDQWDNRLDPTHPEVEDFIVNSIQEMKETGFRYFKFDYNHIGDYRPFNPKMTKFEITRHLFTLYRQAMGDDCYMLACGASPRPVVGLADASRVGWDTLARWKSYPLADDGLPTLPTDIFDGIFTTALSSLRNGILYVNDPDVTYMLPRAESHIWQGPEGSFDPEKHGLKWPGLKTFHSYVGLLGGMAMVSEPLYEPKYQQHNALRMLEILNPPAPDKGWSMNGDIDPWGRQFGFVAERPWGRFASVVLWNKEDGPADIALDTHTLKALGEKFHVWLFWDEQYLGIADASFNAKDVDGHGCELLRLTPVSQNEETPIVVGSNLHITMGSEIKSLDATPAETIIELTDAGARDGKLFIHSSFPLQVSHGSGCDAFVLPLENNIQVLVITDRRRKKKNEIRLIKADADKADPLVKNPDLAERFNKAGFDLKTMN